MFLHYFSVRLLTTCLVVGCFEFVENVSVENADIFTNENLQRPEVRISQGEIQGVNMVTRLGRKIFGFLGIPYAQPPVGNLRFRRPVPAAPWNDTFDGSIDSKPCPQIIGQKIFANEDCLYSNVYTPRLPVAENSTLLPVMVYVHGGRFTVGTNDLTRYGPQFILDKDVVLVVPNYRLGILGFLSTGDEISPGNYGMKDLVLALEWVRDNIRFFGGDPNRVTIVGGSSGAMSVHLLTLSDLTKGLFHRYITQSGSALSIFSHQPRLAYAKRATQVGKHFGCPTNTSAVLVDCLRGLNVTELIHTDSLFHVWNIFPNVVWSPTIESEVEGAFLTDSPLNLVMAGKIRDLPWLESLNRDEGIIMGVFFYDKPDIYKEFFSNLDTLLPVIIPYDNSDDNKTMFFDAVKSYFFNNLTADTNLVNVLEQQNILEALCLGCNAGHFSQLLTNLTQFLGDITFLYPTYRAARQQLISAKQPHYLCSFNYRGTVSYSYMLSRGSTKDWGVSHGDELLYLFSEKKSLFGPPGWEFNDNDWRMVDKMVELWTSFIINGTPTIADSNDTVVWEPYSLQDNYLRIGNGPNISFEIGYNILQDRSTFWKELDALIYRRTRT